MQNVMRSRRMLLREKYQTIQNTFDEEFSMQLQKMKDKVKLDIESEIKREKEMYVKDIVKRVIISFFFIISQIMANKQVLESRRRHQSFKEVIHFSILISII